MVNYTFPVSIDRAFSEFYYEGHEEAIERFASHWGGLDVETFSRVLEEGQGEDKVIALFALGYMATPQARERLLPFLQSTEPMERWASALCLGEMKDEHALPVLQGMLLEGLSPPIDPLFSENKSWLDGLRLRVAYLLGDWGPHSVIPLMRQAFATIWKLEQSEPQDEFLYYYQDALMYALGQRGAFGVLTGLALSPPRRRLAMLYLALGHLRAREHYDRINMAIIIDIDKGLQAEVARVLEQRFGLTAAEQSECIKHYWENSDVRWRRQDDEEETTEEPFAEA